MIVIVIVIVIVMDESDFGVSLRTRALVVVSFGSVLCRVGCCWFWPLAEVCSRQVLWAVGARVCVDDRECFVLMTDNCPNWWTYR